MQENRGRDNDSTDGTSTDQEDAHLDGRGVSQQKVTIEDIEAWYEEKLKVRCRHEGRNKREVAAKILRIYDYLNRWGAKLNECELRVHHDMLWNTRRDRTIEQQMAEHIGTVQIRNGFQRRVWIVPLKLTEAMINKIEGRNV